MYRLKRLISFALRNFSSGSFCLSRGDSVVPAYYGVPVHILILPTVSTIDVLISYLLATTKPYVIFMLTLALCPIFIEQRRL